MKVFSRVIGTQVIRIILKVMILLTGYSEVMYH
jgi:hypothetical protein